MTATVELELKGPMDHLRLVWQTGETLLESIPFKEDPEGTRYNVLLALQEMVTNILRHAYEGDEQNPVRLHFSADSQGFGVEVRDCGSHFNPLEHAFMPPDLEEMPQEEGGYGIMIASMVMDFIDYQRDGDWNCLTMRKLVDAPQHATANGE